MARRGNGLDMPGNKQLRRQAAQLTNAGLPSKRSIRHQFKRQEGDVGGFTSALVALLRGEQGTAGQAYGSAISQQQQIDDAARQQLGNLGEQYGAGSAVKVGATGDSAISGLLAGKAAAQDYASRQPGIAAGRGALAQTGLENAMSDALRQRQDQYRSGFAANYQQVQQNAQSRALALANLGISQQQLALSQRSEAFQESQATASADRQNQQFNAEMIARYGYNPETGQFVRGSGKAASTAAAIGQKYGMTANEIVTLQGHTTTQVEQLLAQGTNWRAALARAEANGVPPEVARFAVMSVYSNPPKPPGRPDKPVKGQFADQAHYDQAIAQWKQQAGDWQRQMAAYQAAIRGFDVQVLWRQIQKRFDSVMHAPAYSTEH